MDGAGNTKLHMACMIEYQLFVQDRIDPLIPRREVAIVAAIDSRERRDPRAVRLRCKQMTSPLPLFVVACFQLQTCLCKRTLS